MDERHGRPSSPKMARGNVFLGQREASTPPGVRGNENVDSMEEGKTSDVENEIVEKMEERATSNVQNMEHAIPIDEWSRQIDRKIREGSQHLVEELESLHKESPSIFRVPGHLSEQSPEHYQPKKVAIGPYHRDNQNDLAFKERDKWAFVGHCMQRHKLDIKEWIRDMMPREAEARSYYPSKDVALDRQSFLEMLLSDGCFILAGMILSSEKVLQELPLGLFPLDFLMLENQIPFFVLNQLYQRFKFSDTNVRERYPTVTDLALHCFGSYRMLKIRSRLLQPPENVLHLLHLFSLSLLPTVVESRDTDKHEEIRAYVPNATELRDESAVRFKKNRTANSLLDIRFHNGVMEIPGLALYDYSNTLFRNLIAFEQLYYPKIQPYVTTYASFMDNMIQKESDASLLEKSGILINRLPASREVVLFFSKLISPPGKHRMRSRYLDIVHADVNEYHKNIRHRWYADLKLNYFSNPWVTLSVVSGAVLLIFGFIQAYYSVLGYYHR